MKSYVAALETLCCDDAYSGDVLIARYAEIAFDSFTYLRGLFTLPERVLAVGMRDFDRDFTFFAG